MMETLHWPRGHLRGYRSIHAVCTCKNSSDRWLQRGRIIVRAMSWVKAIALTQTDDAASNGRWLALMSLKWQLEKTRGSQIKSCFSLCLVIMLINAGAKTYENTFLLHECCFFFFVIMLFLTIRATDWGEEGGTQNLWLNGWHNSLSRTKTGRGIVLFRA